MPDPSPAQASASPFIIFREQLDTYAQALAAGWSDEQYCEAVTRLDSQVATIDGVGFVVTPLVDLETPLSRPVVAKVETGGVAGSHKARHLFGLLLQAEISQAGSDAPLAIASCGNAAVAAAVLAQAADRTLQVFVPTDADPMVVERLHELSAAVVSCRRTEESVGDPCMEALRDAMATGSEPFTVQGPVCPGVLDGARTLGLELADQLLGLPATDIYLQVGGGAFASAVMDGLTRADIVDIPRLHPVQPQRAHPYAAAWERLVPRLLEAAGCADPGSPELLAEVLVEPARAGRFDEIIKKADDVMSPWPTTPASVASGILDDITYDWRPLVHHQLRSGGWPLLPTEHELVAATELARQQVVPPPDATGAAGLAGALIDTGPPERAASAASPAASPAAAIVVLSGVDRAWESST